MLDILFKQFAMMDYFFYTEENKSILDKYFPFYKFSEKYEAAARTHFEIQRIRKRMLRFFSCGDTKVIDNSKWNFPHYRIVA